MTGDQPPSATEGPRPPHPELLVVLGQIVYTSFASKGFQLLASEGLDPRLGELFLERVFGQIWNVYDPPPTDYRAVFLLATAEGPVLFGWVYNDGLDDLGRAHVPYWVCYFSSSPFTALQFEQLLACLEHGPTAPLVDRWSLPTAPPPVSLNGSADRPGFSLNTVARSEAQAALIAPGRLWTASTHAVYQGTASSGRKSLPTLTQWRWVLPGFASILALVALVLGARVITKPEPAPVVPLVLPGQQPKLVLPSQQAKCFVGSRPTTEAKQPNCTSQGWQGAVEQIIHDHRGADWAVAIDPKGQLLASAGEDGRIYLRRLSDGGLLSTMTIPGRKRIRALSFRPNYPGELAAAGDGPIAIWKFDSRVPLQFLKDSGITWTLAWDKGGRLYSTSSDGAASRWDTGRGRRTASTKPGRQRLYAGVLDPNGQSFIIGGSDGMIRFWDTRLRRITLQFAAHTNGVRTLAIDPKGRWLVSGSWDRTVKVWGLSDGHLIWTLLGHTDRVICSAISPDGSVLATAGRDHTIRLWDLKTGRLLNTLTSHHGWVLALAFSPNSQTLVSTSKDSTVHIWRKSEP